MPGTVGLNVTLIWQLEFAAKEDMQLFVWAKSPVVVMLLMVSAPFPVLERVSTDALEVVPTVWFGKVMLLGLRVATGPTPIPVPVRPTVCGLPCALSVSAKVPVRAPVPVGENVI